uniref:Uncharacterized protein n=1 Tax=viral metagenome TaxID=1070528 RepID=A0A6C0DEA1_9ZZZZ
MYIFRVILKRIREKYIFHRSCPKRANLWLKISILIENDPYRSQRGVYLLRRAPDPFWIICLVQTCFNRIIAIGIFPIEPCLF